MEVDKSMALKNRSRFSTTIDIELDSKLKKLSEITRIPTSKLVDEALEDLMMKYKHLFEK